MNDFIEKVKDGAIKGWDESILDHAKFFTSTPWRRENYKKFIGEKDYIKAAKAIASGLVVNSSISISSKTNNDGWKRVKNKKSF